MKANYVKILGTIGILAVFFTIISDVILLGRPDNAYSFFAKPTECMAEIAPWRITAGVFIGVFMLPFQLAGLAPLYYGLKPLGRRTQLLAVIPSGHALTMGIAFHMSYAFMASGWKLYHAAVPGNQTAAALGNDLLKEAPWNDSAALMMKSFDFYWKLLIVIMLAELIFCSCFFAITVLRGKTLFPKWMAAFNPLLIIGAMFVIIFLIPSPVGGFIAPTILNTSNFVFFILSTVIIINRTKDLKTI